MEIKFDFIIRGTGEAVFLVNKEHKIYCVKGLNSLHQKYSDNEQILIELEQARAALFEDKMQPVK